VAAAKRRACKANHLQQQFGTMRRLHSTLGYVSPMRFEENWRAGQAKKAA